MLQHGSSHSYTRLLGSPALSEACSWVTFSISNWTGEEKSTLQKINTCLLDGHQTWVKEPVCLDAGLSETATKGKTYYWEVFNSPQKITPRRWSCSQLAVIKMQLLSLALRANTGTIPWYCTSLQSDTHHTSYIWELTDYSYLVHQILWGGINNKCKIYIQQGISQSTTNCMHRRAVAASV